MKHNIISKEHISSKKTDIVIVDLIGENEIEQTAIRNTVEVKATPEEKEFVDYYLNSKLGLGNYSVVGCINQVGTSFTLEIIRQ